jgi:hypothetical protein
MEKRMKWTYIILVDDLVGDLVDVEGVEYDGAFLASSVEVLGTLGQRTRNSQLLVIVSKPDVVILE